MPSRKKKVRIVSLLLAVFITVFCPSFLFTASGADTLASLNKEQKNLQAQIKRQKEKGADQSKIIKNLDAQQAVIQKQIDECNKQIVACDKQLASLNVQINEKTKEIDENKQAFKERIRVMYMTGNSTSLSLLLSADDFGDFLYKTELLESVTERDNTIISELKDRVEAIQSLKSQSEQDKQKQQQLIKVQKTKIQELSNVQKEAQKAKQSTTKAIKDLDAQLDKNAEKIKAIQEADRRAAAAAAVAKNSNVVYNGSQFLWPVPGYYYISSGYRTASRPNHKGIDVAGSAIYGKPIVAVASGTIIIAGFNAGGYGNYIMINHGNSNGHNYSTLYGHCSSLAVSVGQQVKAGQVIGYVGSTGRSTGPHLHYEVRVNGNPTNPMGYYSKVK